MANEMPSITKALGIPALNFAPSTPDILAHGRMKSAGEYQSPPTT
jgi:hypothetical protein